LREYNNGIDDNEVFNNRRQYTKTARPEISHIINSIVLNCIAGYLAVLQSRFKITKNKNDAVQPMLYAGAIAV